MIRVLIIATILLCGCNNPGNTLPLERVVTCSECVGKGKVIYREDNPIVLNGLGKPGVYECPICGGSGKLIEYETADVQAERSGEE